MARALAPGGRLLFTDFCRAAGACTPGQQHCLDRIDAAFASAGGWHSSEQYREIMGGRAAACPTASAIFGGLVKLVATLHDDQCATQTKTTGNTRQPNRSRGQRTADRRRRRLDRPAAGLLGPGADGKDPAARAGGGGGVPAAGPDRQRGGLPGRGQPSTKRETNPDPHSCAPCFVPTRSPLITHKSPPATHLRKLKTQPHRQLLRTAWLCIHPIFRLEFEPLRKAAGFLLGSNYRIMTDAFRSGALEYRAIVAVKLPAEGTAAAPAEAPVAVGACEEDGCRRRDQQRQS
jgi:hypothetical protein